MVFLLRLMTSFPPFICAVKMPKFHLSYLGVDDSDKNIKTPVGFADTVVFGWFSKKTPAVLGLGTMPQIFPPFFIFLGYALSVGGTSAGHFAALNLAYPPASEASRVFIFRICPFLGHWQQTIFINYPDSNHSQGGLEICLTNFTST